VAASAGVDPALWAMAGDPDTPRHTASAAAVASDTDVRFDRPRGRIEDATT
jgi:hypothetical protein